MAWFPIEANDVTAEWLSDVMDDDVRTCRLEQIGIGFGLLGRLYRAHLTGGRDVPSSVVVKLPTLDTETREKVCKGLQFYHREVRFYQQLARCNPLPPPRLFFAAFDEATHDFILVLRDLGRLRTCDQTVGCTIADAEKVVDAVATQHAYWWRSLRLASLSWLPRYNADPFPAVLATNFQTAWPRFLERIGSSLSPELCRFGERFVSLLPWLLDEISRPPHTLLHGDLRLDQLFFAIDNSDPPVTALDWQMTFRGRGCYDLAYFLSQSLSTETRRRYEQHLTQRYSERLADRGIDYPEDQLRHDYRLTTALCFIYPVVGAGAIDVANDRQLFLLHRMLDGSVSAIEDHDVLALSPG